MSEPIHGIFPVFEALRAGIEMERILISRSANKKQIADLLRLARRKGVPIIEKAKQDLNDLVDGNTQGIVAYVKASPYVSVQTILQESEKRGEPPFLALLDGIEDPHNLGAILRSADGVGVHGVIIPQKRSAGLTGTVAKTSAGASLHVKTAQVANLSFTIEALKQQNIWFVGADQQAELLYTEADLTGALGIVVGGEGSGLHRLVKAKCDFLVKIPMRGKVNSLNASVAAALLFFEVRRQRSNKN